MKDEIAYLMQDIKSIVGDKEIFIVAASKMQTVETIDKLPEYGIDTVGENRVQEFLEKYSPNSPLKWQFIGVLQSNKVKYIVDKVTLIQSVDSLSLAKEIEKQCAKRNLIMPILIEVNYGREPQKSGVLPENLYELIDAVTALPHVKINGLMTVMPIGASEEKYCGMNELYNKCKKDYQKIDFKYLSMGMSADYPVALKCGANMIRIGEKIFGKRNYVK
ncbi:MAG TPA: YggS family pyridoxal phosphate-dependent enzyme [Clostridia bacterium]|nr:YggS family pyridoxal phosphate-dependent enzyme [Clostridia bacterium]